MRLAPSKTRKISVRSREMNPMPPKTLEECPEGKLLLPSETNFGAPVQITLSGRYLGSGTHLDMKSGLRRPTGDY